MLKRTSGVNVLSLPRLLRAVALLVTTSLIVALGVANPMTSQAATTDDFISQWTVAGGSLDVTLPLYQSGNYNFTVDWGDGNQDVITNENATHTYGAADTYTVTISTDDPELGGNGVIEGWRFGNQGDKSKIVGISQWGSLQLGNFGGSFWGCNNLVVTASDGPDLTGTTRLDSAFRNAQSVTQIGNWDVTSGITDMSLMFSGAQSFDQDVSDWDVGGVTNMASMFSAAQSFDQNLGSWDVGNVTNMNSFLAGVTLSSANYDALLVGWDALGSLQSNVTFSGGNSKYSGAAVAARSNLIDDYSWNISDGGIAAPTATSLTPTSGFETGGTVLTIEGTNFDDSANVKFGGCGGIDAAAVVVDSQTQLSVTTPVHAPGEITVAVLNDGGCSLSATNFTFLPLNVPDAPTGVVGVSDNGAVTVSWSAPANDGGSPIVGYTVTSAPGDAVCTTAGETECVVGGLTNGTPYTFTVTATNDQGDGPESVPSDPVTPEPNDAVKASVQLKVPGQVLRGARTNVRVKVVAASQRAGTAARRSVARSASTPNGKTTIRLKGKRLCVAKIKNGVGACRGRVTRSGKLTFTGAFVGTVRTGGKSFLASGTSSASAWAGRVAITSTKVRRPMFPKCVFSALVRGQDVKRNARVVLLRKVGNGKWRRVATTRTTKNKRFSMRATMSRQVIQVRVKSGRTYTPAVVISMRKGGLVTRGC